MGSKAAMLCTMSVLGLPVPPGFAISPDLCRSIADKTQDFLPVEITDALQELERITGCLLEGTRKPLLLAIRSSSAVSVPGTGDAVLNIGFNDDTVEALAQYSGELRFAYDSYCRFIQNYAQVVMGDDPAAFEDVLALYMEERGYVSDTEMQGSDMRELANRLRPSLKATTVKVSRKTRCSNSSLHALPCYGRGLHRAPEPTASCKGWTATRVSPSSCRLRLTVCWATDQVWVV